MHDGDSRSRPAVSRAACGPQHLSVVARAVLLRNDVLQASHLQLEWVVVWW